MPLDTLLIDYFISNIARSIFNQIGLDTNKFYETKNVIRENIYHSPLFNQNINLKNLNDFRNEMNKFTDNCLNDVLELIV
ncbi:hypothetical protein TRFO_34802 [Tritrichomonas foetus]|uniref:Uncharacterized protein n=1 Tax=Tritrichomonas foetus TaxID=1144522 RepID=A0A1J4JJU9_9EUKA|nr:hypothetical protein TRFO_34802 [Tritrichomonas foetus]|eukprot:OHS98889.1 hypothetical protein TRFO_34802 [Tritrichomonas foetus]